VMGGHVPLMVGTAADMMPHIKAGRLRLLASASPVRWAELPDVATVKEAGFDASIDSLFGLAAPAGVPQERLKKLRDTFAKAASSPEFSEALARLGMSPTYMDGDQYRDFLREGYVTMGRQLTEAGFIKGK